MHAPRDKVMFYTSSVVGSGQKWPSRHQMSPPPSVQVSHPGNAPNGTSSHLQQEPLDASPQHINAVFPGQGHWPFLDHLARKVCWCKSA